MFHSYSVYTPELIETNAAYFRGASAPRYVMLHPIPVDVRWPTTEDSGALLEIIDHYRPVLFEGSWLLLERMPQNDPQKPAGTVVLQKSLKFGESLSLAPVPGNYQTITIDVQPTLWGKLRTMAYRTARMQVKLATEPPW